MMQFKPVRVKATNRESAIEQALQMVGVTIEDVSVEVLSEEENGVTVRVSPREVDEQDVAETENTEEADENQEENFEEESPDNAVSDAALESAQQHARDAAQDLLDRMGLDAEAVIAEASLDSEEKREGVSHAFIDVDGGDVGILIGKHGQTLRSFQYLLNLILNNDDNEPSKIYVTVDAGDYRAKRKETIERITRRAIERARREYRAIRLEPMPAYERRLAHLLVQDEEDLTSTSDGHEPRRCVVIVPDGVSASSARFHHSRRGKNRRYNRRSR